MIDFAPIRSWLFSFGFRVNNQSLNDIPHLSLIDAGLIPKIGWNRTADFFKNFEGYRKSMRDMDWSCLTSFYPRSYYLFYYYLLFWWADYCNVLVDVVRSPARSLVAELFFRYIMDIDRIIDDPRDGNVMLMNPSRIKRNLNVSGDLNAFLEHLNRAEISSRVKRQICKRFWEYRNESLSACQEAHLLPNAGLNQILSCKHKTVGGLFCTWSAILGGLYCPDSSRHLIENAGLILSKACMAMQIHEDLLDLPEDFRGQILNIFHEILKLHPAELGICKEYVAQTHWQHLDGIWARQKLPASYKKAQELVDHYLRSSLEGSLIKEKAVGLYQLLGNVNSHPVGI